MIPKYRAWDVDSMTMYEVKSIVYTLKSILGVNRTALYPERTLYWDSGKVVIMQSTRLFDKNGKEIFDGDIVRFTVTNKAMCGLYQVRRANSGEWRIDNRTQGHSLYIAGSHNCEVVGNIYENPELLEVK